MIFGRPTIIKIVQDFPNEITKVFNQTLDKLSYTKIKMFLKMNKVYSKVVFICRYYKLTNNHRGFYECFMAE